jgi:uncharacterized membrane protein (GlpM family)
MIVSAMDYLQTLIKFVAGGSIIVGVTFLAQQANPRYGGILAAAPIITSLAFLFTYSEAGSATAQQLVLETFLFAIPLLAFLISLYFLMNRFSFLGSLGAAYGIWIGCVLVICRIVPGL